MAGSMLPALTPKQYEPGLLDAGGLPVRVRHIFQRYRQYMGESIGRSSQGSLDRSSTPAANRFDGSERMQGKRFAPSRAASYTAVQDLNGSGGQPRPVSPSQQPSLQMLFPVTQETDYAADYVDKEEGFETLVEHGKPLVIESYTGVIEPRKEQEFALVLLSRSIPAASLIIQIDGSIICKTFLVGRTLRATIPPLMPGRHSVSISDTNGVTQLIQLGGLVGSTSRGPETEALSLIVVPYPPSRRQPRLCYSAKGQRRHIEAPASSSLASGPYTAAELDEFVAATERQVWAPNRTLVPFGKIPGRDEKNGKATTFDERLKKCLQMAYNQKMPIRQSDGGPAFVPDDLSDCRIPLAFKASLFSSCQPSTRNAIAYFHSELFEFLPFGVVSAHIFTKSHPSDKITIFAFTLTPPEPLDRTVQPGSHPGNVPSLDRFEVSERLCADTRHWKHTDTCIPRKNKEAAMYQFSTADGAQCPIPQSLRHSMNPYKDYPEGLEIAPFVYIYFEPWPEQELPMPHPRPPSGKWQSPGSEKSSISSSAVAARALGEGRAADKPGGGAAVRPEEHTAVKQEGGATVKPVGSGGEEETIGDGPYFSVTLCVGKYIFSSVLGVHIKVLSGIFKDWLKVVPLKRGNAQQLVRLRLTDVAPIASTPPVPDRALCEALLRATDHIIRQGMSQRPSNI